MLKLVRSMALVFALIFTSTNIGFLANDAQAANLQLGASMDEVPITSGFNGTDITVFGTIENYKWDVLKNGEYFVAIEVIGPSYDVVMRKKDRVAGIWINRDSRLYSTVPAFYSIATNAPLSGAVPNDQLKKLDLGIDNIPMNLVSRGNQTFILPAPDFSSALRRIRSSEGLFFEDTDALQYLSPTLFRASIRLPANVPIGRHTIKAYLFEKGRFVASRSSEFMVRKTGFERWIYDMAHQNSLVYGIMAVLLAIATGWLANVIFKKD